MGSVVWAARVPDHWSRSAAVIRSGLLTEPFCPAPPTPAARLALSGPLTTGALLNCHAVGVCEHRIWPRNGLNAAAYRVSDPDVACAALLHDAVEDHADGLEPDSGPQGALAVLAGRFGGRAAALVTAVTNPAWEPGRDAHEQCREQVLASLAASPWARVIKASDITDNAVGIIHLTGPKLARLAGKYGPLVPALRELILRPDTPRWPPTSRI